ncbi:MAG: hypothetical protein N2053_04445 [Chitinispirillaceae bacterium]|nr:hypothetical protein [Chitinispirillaceae bacterium]
MLKKLFFLLILLIFLLCKNPFFPPSGVPQELHPQSLRSTPQGVIEQLIESYESRRIDLFKDLFPEDGSFKFFVAPDFFNDYLTKYQKLSETRDERLKLIGQYEYYYYWTQDAEIESHTRLFSQAASIRFIGKPMVESIRKFTDNNDSLAELLVTGGILEIGKYIDVDTIEIFTANISRQVFLVGKDSKNLWVILKWYDFSGNG